MILTNEIIEKGKSCNGGWSANQLKCFRIKFPLKKGWKRKIIGKNFSTQQIEKFLSLKDKHLENKEVLSSPEFESFLDKTRE